MQATLRIVGWSIVLAPWLATTAPADVVTIQPSRDNTLFEDGTGSLSNGAGPVLFAGNSGQDLARRALLFFDVAGAVPAGRRIEEAALTLYVSNAPNSTLRAFALHRVMENWGEGTSSTTSGSGAPATTGDATWIHAYWSSPLWSSVGGSFSSAPSGAQQVGAVGFYTWTDPQMTADAQSWLDDPTGNHGWVLIGDEVTLNTARRFDSRENTVPENRPALTIHYSGSVGIVDAGRVQRIALGPSIPNPSSQQVRVAFALPSAAHARLEVTDLAGRRVATLIDAWVGAGQHVTAWDGSDARGGHAGAGIYYYHLSVDGRPAGIGRMVRLR